jgi:hypothetical protein
VINGTCTTSNLVPPYTKFYKLDPPYFPHLHVFGDISVVATTINRKITAKTTNRGTVALYLGLAPDHSATTYRMYNLTTNRVILTRNVRYMKIKYNDYFRTNATNNQYAIFQEDDADNEDNADTPVSPNVDEMSTGTPLYNNQPDMDEAMPSLIEDDTSLDLNPPETAEISFSQNSQRGLSLPTQRIHRNTIPLPEICSEKLKNCVDYTDSSIQKWFKHFEPHHHH